MDTRATKRYNIHKAYDAIVEISSAQMPHASGIVRAIPRTRTWEPHGLHMPHAAMRRSGKFTGVLAAKVVCWVIF